MLPLLGARTIKFEMTVLNDECMVMVTSVGATDDDGFDRSWQLKVEERYQVL
jgi:hypothetical protein